MEKDSYDARIKKLEKALQAARNDRSQALARKEVLERDLLEINHRIAELGCKPEELDARIKEIRTEIDSLIKRVQDLLPSEYLEKVGW
ncbi:MAG: hypothetical protein ACM3MK_10470 [Chitinophagales bacterium]